MENIPDYPRTSAWYTYIVCCRDHTLYTGITKNPDKRIAEHNSDNAGAKYTRPRRPVYLVYLEGFSSRSAATKREYQLKKMRRTEKKELIEKQQA